MLPVKRLYFLYPTDTLIGILLAIYKRLFTPCIHYRLIKDKPPHMKRYYIICEIPHVGCFIFSRDYAYYHCCRALKGSGGSKHVNMYQNVSDCIIYIFIYSAIYISECLSIWVSEYWQHTHRIYIHCITALHIQCISISSAYTLYIYYVLHVAVYLCYWYQYIITILSLLPCTHNDIALC